LLPRSKSLAPASRAPVPACRCWRRRTKRSRLRATGQRSTCARLARRRRLPLRALRRLAPVALQQHPNRWCRRRREPPGSRGLGGPGRRRVADARSADAWLAPLARGREALRWRDA